MMNKTIERIENNRHEAMARVRNIADSFFLKEEPVNNSIADNTVIEILERVEVTPYRTLSIKKESVERPIYGANDLPEKIHFLKEMRQKYCRNLQRYRGERAYLPELLDSIKEGKFEAALNSADMLRRSGEPVEIVDRIKKIIFRCAENEGSIKFRDVR